jgi:HPt (histidine-containing phosphotransfer) domain-containing protein
MSDRPNHEPVFSLHEALARVDDDRETFQMIAELFIEHGPKDLADVRAALEAGNATDVGRSSHRLKGAMLQFCAPSALQACMELEASAKAGTLARGGQLYAALEQEFNCLLTALRQVLDKGMAA